MKATGKTEHVSIERIRLVANDRNAFFTEEEQRHIQECLECLTSFEEIFWSDEDNHA